MAEPTLHTFRASDGYEWRYRHWKSPAAPRGTVIGLHGIQSHGGWYGASCSALAAAGYAVSFLDRRGCGLNTAARGDAPSFRRLLDDIAEFVAPLPRPRFLLGISWGGKLAVGLERRHRGLADGLVLVAPGLRSRVRPPLRERLTILLSRLRNPGRQFVIPLNDPELFTGNPVWQEYIRSDDVALRTATARLLFESARMDVYLHLAARYVRAPVLLLLAEQDRIIDNAATRRLVERFATSERTIIEYAGAHHTLEFEPDGAPFVDDVLGWLNERSSNHPADPDARS